MSELGSIFLGFLVDKFDTRWIPRALYAVYYRHYHPSMVVCGDALAWPEVHLTLCIMQKKSGQPRRFAKGQNKRILGGPDID